VLKNFFGVKVRAFCLYSGGCFCFCMVFVGLFSLFYGDVLLSIGTINVVNRDVCACWAPWL